MATATIRGIVVILLAVQLLCRGHGVETCGEVASPWPKHQNFSLQCGAVIEDDLPDSQVDLLQVDLRLDKNTTGAALINHYQGHLQAQQTKKLVKKDAEEKSVWNAAIQKKFRRDEFDIPPALGLRAKRAMETAMVLKANISSLSSAATSVRKTVVVNGEAKRAANGLKIIFVLGLICIGGVMACMLLEAFPEDLNFRAGKQSPKNSPQQFQRQGQHQAMVSPQGSPRCKLPTDVGSSPAMPICGSLEGAGMATRWRQRQSIWETHLARILRKDAKRYMVSLAMSLRTVWCFRHPGGKKAHRERYPPPILGGSPFSDRLGQGSNEALSRRPASSHHEGWWYPIKSLVVIIKAQDPVMFFPGAGAPAIASSLIMSSTSVVLTIPITEIIGMAQMAQAGHTEKLDILSSKGKAMLSGRVDNASADGLPAFVISSVGGGDDLPRAYIKPRGQGPREPFDVLGPRGDAYGTLTHSGKSLSILRHQDRPVLKLNKVTDLPLLDMKATTMDGKFIANGSCTAGDNWTLTVGPGADSVLICACMIGLTLFGEVSK